MSVYQDRIQGTDRTLRIRRMKKAVYVALILLSVLLVYARFAAEGASVKPLFFPVNGLLEVGLIMGLVGTIFGIYFRNMEIQATVRESPRYLMAKYSMSRAMTTAILCLVVAVILLLPVTAASSGSAFTEPGRNVAIAGYGSETITFTSPDPFGVSFVAYLTVTTTSGHVYVTLTKAGTVQGTPFWINSTSRTVPVEPKGWASLANWNVTLKNADPGGVVVNLVLTMAITPTLFTTVPFLLLLIGVANIGWWVGLRPVRAKAKSAALYAGSATETDMGERAWAEYAQAPPPTVAAEAGFAEPPPPPPTTAPPPPPSPAVATPSATVPQPAPRPAAPRTDTPETLVSKGDSLAAIQQYPAALMAYDEALRRDPDHVPALRAKAAALQAQGRDGPAIDVHRRVLSLEPGDDASLRAVATILVKGARWREGLEAVDAALKRRPNDSSFLELRGDVLSNLGRRPEALTAYEASLALDPKNENVKQKIEEVRVDVPGLLSRALIASAQGNYAQALNLFDDILEVEPSNVNALIGKAVAYRRSGKPQEALNCLDLVLNIQPTNAAAFLNRGTLLVERGDYEAALEAYDKLVALTPADEEAWAAHGDVLARLGRDDDAIRSYNEALKLNPGDEEIRGKIEELQASRPGQADVLQELYKVKGVGPARAKALLDAGFRTPEEFAKATVEQLVSVKGITRRIAEDLVKHFRGALVEAR